MEYSAIWNTLPDKANPFRAGWAWIVSGLTVVMIGASPLLLYIGLENVTGSSGGNPIGLGLLAMAAFGLSQLCIVLALISPGPHMDSLWDFSHVPFLFLLGSSSAANHFYR